MEWGRWGGSCISSRRLSVNGSPRFSILSNMLTLQPHPAPPWTRRSLWSHANTPGSPATLLCCGHTTVPAPLSSPLVPGRVCGHAQWVWKPLPLATKRLPAAAGLRPFRVLEEVTLSLSPDHGDSGNRVVILPGPARTRQPLPRARSGLRPRPTSSPEALGGPRSLWRERALTHGGPPKKRSGK